MADRWAYYNENEPFAAQWLRNLIAAGRIAPGEVDERSIHDVQPDDVRGFAQAHFFAGLGGWSYALRLAGWSDDQPVWTGSCPCQPFSVAGKQQGTADDRHLWPEFARLIGECSPPTVLGEQVASKAGRTWLTTVRADMESLGYAVGAADLCAASLGAPHIRQRLWWVADSHGGQPRQDGTGRIQPGRKHRQQPQDGRAGRLLADANQRDEPRNTSSSSSRAGVLAPDERRRGPVEIDSGGTPSILADTSPGGQREHGSAPGRAGHPALGYATDSLLGDADDTGLEGRGVQGRGRSGERSAWSADGDVGAWRDIVWLPCRDGKARPTQPGTFPLAHGIPGRVGRLRAYGNAIVPQVAAEFIGVYLEAIGKGAEQGSEYQWVRLLDAMDQMTEATTDE